MGEDYNPADDIPAGSDPSSEQATIDPQDQIDPETITDPVMRAFIQKAMVQMAARNASPSVPAPGSGVGRAAGLLLRGASLGLTGYPRPPEGLGESALEFVGSIPTIAAIGATTGPLVAPLVRAAGVGARAIPYASRVAGAAATGGVVGGVEAGARGEDVLPGAAQGAALFGGTESLLAARKLLQALKMPKVGGAITPEVMPSGVRMGPGRVGQQLALGTGQKALPLPPGVTPQPGRVGPQRGLPPSFGTSNPAEGIGAPGRVGPQRALVAGSEDDQFASRMARGETWDQATGGVAEATEEDLPFELRKYLLPEAPKPDSQKVARTISSIVNPEVEAAVDAATRIPPPKTALTMEAEQAVRREPRLDLESSRADKSPSAFAAADEATAERLADNPTRLADIFLSDPKKYTASGGLDLESALVEDANPKSFLGRFKELRDKITSPLYASSAGETMKKMGFFWNLRTQRGAFGEQVSATVLNKAAMVNIQAENFKAQWVDEFMNALKPLGKTGIKNKLFGIPEELDKKLFNLLQKIDRNGKYVGEAGIYTEGELQAGKNLRGVYNRLFDVAKEHGMDPDKYINQYVPLVRKRPTGIVREANPTYDEQQFIQFMDPKEARFVHELERTGKITDVDPTATAGFNSYISGLANAKLRRPFFEGAENVMSEHFGAKWVRMTDGRAVVVAKDPVGYQAWKEFEHHMMGGITTTDVNIGYSLDKILSKYGLAADKHALYKVTGGLQSAYYAGAMGSPLGGRPASIIRQFSQLVPTFAEMGAKYTMAGMQKAFDSTYIKTLREAGIIQSPFEHALERVTLARGAGRAISQISETMLKLFSATDQMMRVITAGGAEARFNDYLSRNMLSKLPGRKEMRAQVMKLAGAGNVEEAKLQYMMDNVAQLQYVYGKANRPQVLRGAFGNLVGMFTSYPLNTFEMYRSFGKRALEGDVGPLVRMLGLSTGLMMAGSQFANADLRSAFFLGAVPYSLTFPSIAGNVYTAGRTSVEALSGNLLMVGETDYHKKNRMDAYRQAARDLRGFVPGGVFMMQDLPALADERTVGNLFAMTPKADVQNQLARERADASRNSQRLTGFPPIR